MDAADDDYAGDSGAGTHGGGNANEPAAAGQRPSNHSEVDGRATGAQTSFQKRPTSYDPDAAQSGEAEGKSQQHQLAVGNSNGHEYSLDEYDAENVAKIQHHTQPDAKDEFLEDDIPEAGGVEDDEVTTIEIPNDSFSMFYVASDFLDHILPTCVFLLQISILALIATNLLQENDSSLGITLNVPVDVPWAVTASQYIACFVSVFSADDFIIGMLYFNKRIIRKEYSLLNDGGTPPTSLKWEISNGMRMVEGALVIFVSLIFIIQSSTAIDLFLNFTGVAFVSFLDDTAFRLTKNRFLGFKARRLTQRVLDLRAYDDSMERTAAGKMEICRYILFVLMTGVMWGGLSFFVHQQDSMDYACRRVSIEVGETRYAWARHLSGIYSRSNETKNYERAMYVKDEGVKALIAYSDQNQRWFVGYGDIGDDGWIYHLVSGMVQH